MAKRMLADLLWEAANTSLLARAAQERSCLWSPEWSCNALCAVLKKHGIDDEGAQEFVRSLGCDTGSTDMTFGQARGPKRQGVRYMWLLLAMHVAQDEGIEV